MIYYKVFYYANNKEDFKFVITEVPEHLDTADRFVQARCNVSEYLKHDPIVKNFKISHASYLYSDRDFIIPTVKGFYDVPLIPHNYDSKNHKDEK